MPYTAENAPEYVQKMPEDKKKLWLGVFNGIMESCKKDKKTCEGLAFATANKRVGMTKSVDVDEIENVEEIKLVYEKMYGDAAYVYIPPGINTMADAMALMDAQEKAKELSCMVDIYTQVQSRISADPNIANKKAALASLAGEFQSMMADEMVPDTSAKAMMMKKEKDGEHPNSHYLVCEDPKQVTTWHLRYKDMEGKVDHGLMGAAWAALHGGYRGKKYEGPNKEEAINKLKRVYKQEGMSLPGGGKSEDFTMSVAEFDEYLGWRYDRSGVVKSIGTDRVGGYGVLWGDETRKDLTKEWFTQKTADLTVIFDAIGRLPLLYHHALDGKVKTTVIGIVDTMQPDDVGMWYEAQLKLADDYGNAIRDLISKEKLKTSSQTLASGRKVLKSGEIVRWPTVELSLTPTPAEPRMLAVEELKSIYGDDFPEVLNLISADPGDSDTDGSDNEKLCLKMWLELEKLKLETVL